MQEGAPVLERRRREHDAVVARAERALVGRALHAQEVLRALGHAEPERDRVGVLGAFLVLAAGAHVEYRLGPRARDVALLGVEGQEQDFAPVLGIGKRRTGLRERVREHGVGVARDLAPALPGSCMPPHVRKSLRRFFLVA